MVSIDAKFDGQDYPLQGSRVATAWPARASFRGAAVGLGFRQGDLRADGVAEQLPETRRMGKEENTVMGRKDGENLNVLCPCCQAKLVVDPMFGAVLSHEAPVKPGPDVDLTKAGSILNEQQRQREDKFADSWFKESNKEDILAKKFEEAMKKAKDAPAGKPIRDFDLD